MYIGIDLGGTNIVAGVLDEQGNILHKESIKTNAQRPYEDIVRDMAELAKTAAKNAGFQPEDAQWVGVGCPGTCDPEKGSIVYANNLPFANTPLREEFQKHYSVPFYVENDANCAALGEMQAGGAKDTKNSVTITLGTGVGGGVIIDGQIMSGHNHAGAELGHMIIVADGEPCSCGNQGCWEAYASATALIRQTRQAMEQHHDSLLWEVAGDDKISARTAFDAAKRGDAVGKQLVENYLKYVSIGLLNIITIFQPEKILIGGGVSGEGEYILQPIRDYVAAHDYCKVPEKRTKIMRAQLGNDAGIIGAGFLGKQYGRR